MNHIIRVWIFRQPDEDVYPGTEERGQKNELVLQSESSWWREEGGGELLTNGDGHYRKPWPVSNAATWKRLEACARPTRRDATGHFDGSMGGNFLRKRSEIFTQLLGPDPLNFTSGEFHLNA